MRTALAILLGLIGGYGVGAVAGWLLVTLLSGNAHDRSVEAVMTAAFATGPLGAVIGAVVLAMKARR